MHDDVVVVSKKENVHLKKKKKEAEAEESKWKNEIISVLKTQTQKKGKITIS